MHSNHVEDKPAKGIEKLKQLWPTMTAFERFEYIVMLFVSILLAIIILAAFFRLLENVYDLVITVVTDKSEFKIFQTTFGMLLTLLIAFEFRNSIDAILEGKGLLFQAKIIVLIAIVAVARKFLVLDPSEYEASKIAAYAGVGLSLGIVYWLLSRNNSEDKDLTSRA